MGFQLVKLGQLITTFQIRRRAMTNALEGDLPSMVRDILETSVNEGTLSIDGVCGRARCQLERFQLHRLG